jgi:hypothetical protein
MKRFRHLRNKTIFSVALDDESIASVQLSFTDGTAYAIVVKQAPLQIEAVSWKGKEDDRTRPKALSIPKAKRMRKG